MKTLESHILEELYFESPQSIASLSKKIGKSIPIITKSIQELVLKKIILETGLAPSNGGRRANLYALNSKQTPYILIISIDQYQTTLALFDFSNTCIQNTQQIVINLAENKDFVQVLITEINTFIIDVDLNKIIAISITMPGFVNTELGINSSYSITDDRCQIKNIIAQQYKKQTFIENDSTTIAIAEHKFGKTKNIQDLLVINLNWGVGLGMIINNKLFRGSSGLAGEFSHIPLSNLNKICSCGKRGCLEVEASLEAAIVNATTKLKKGDSSILTTKFPLENKIEEINTLFEAAKKGDQLAIEAFGNIGYALGKGIATLIHIINPQKIIISGYGSKIRQFLMPQIQSALLQFSIQRLSENTEIEISTLTNVQLIGTMANAITHLDWQPILYNKS